MRKILLAFLCACLLVSSACSLPFVKLTQDESGNQNIEFFSGVKTALEPKPTATPTPTPSGRVDAADTALLAGQMDKAKGLYQEAFNQTDDEEIRSQALYGLGRCYYSERNYGAAIDAFNRILGQYPSADVMADAYFMLGQAYQQTEEYSQAADAYAKYAQYTPGVLDQYVLTLEGDAAAKAGDYTQAIYAYQAALQADPPGDSSSLNLKIGQAYDGLMDYTTAIQYFMNVYNTSTDDYARATANLLTGQAYLKLEMPDEAYKRFLDSVYQFPKAYDSFTALSILVTNGVPVNDYVRGLVDYYAGSYDYAIDAFDRYLATDPEDNDGSVYYFRGLSHFFNNEFRQAISDYQFLIDNYPGNAYWSAAWDEIAYIQWVDLDEYTNAANTYLSFVNNAPSSPDAPAYLYEAGRVFERNDDLENAAETWLRMMNEYPSSDLSYRGLFQAGITYYRLARYDDSLQAFQRMLVLATTPADKAKAYMWIGKTYMAQGDLENANNAFASGESADPTDYYSIRSGELLEGRNMFDVESSYDLGYDLNYERPEADAWLRNTFNIPVDTNLDGLGDLQDNPRIKRIQAYWEISQYGQAINEAEMLRNELQGDALNLYRLMNYLVSLDLYQPAIYTCRNILSLAALDDLTSLTAPIYFTHIRFGAYFRDLIVSSANDYDIPPLLMYALVRQESMFNPFITSGAGASGLAQIMPATGKENVDLLGWPSNYETADLLKGEVSIELGAFYLSRMLKIYPDNIQASLASYNAGWGIVKIWLDKSAGDPDLFLEVIPEFYQETQDYLKQITEFLNIYQLVYSRPQ